MFHNSILGFAEQGRKMNEAFYQNLRQRYEIIIKDTIAKHNTDKKNNSQKIIARAKQ